MIAVVALAATVALIAFLSGAGPSLFAWPQSGMLKGKPTPWVVPSPKVLAATWSASKAFNVPVVLMLAIGHRETNFRPLRGIVLPKSYAKWRDKTVPGSSKTWGQLYPESQWRAYGYMQLLPVNIVGVPGDGLRPGEPLTRAFEPRRNARLAARYLRNAYEKRGSWLKAIWAYNGVQDYVDDVVGNVRALGGRPSQLGDETS